jgi:DNA repair protein RadC
MNLTWVTTELRVRKEVPPATMADLPRILAEEGMFDATQEVFWVVAYDAMANLRVAADVARGDYYRVGVSIPAVLNIVLLSGANRFYIGHNHPSGRLQPTKKDLDLTTQISVGAALVGAYLEDHWVIGPGGKVWSMVDRGQFTPSPEIVSMYAANGPIVTHARRKR